MFFVYIPFVGMFLQLFIIKQTMANQNNDTQIIGKETLSTFSDKVIKKVDILAIDPEDKDACISTDELELLDSGGGEEDNLNLKEAQLDYTDDDGEALNEGSDFSGKDLDVPGNDLDDADELIGEEDEENNSYSKSDQDD